MQFYQVGGSVRDELLGLPVQDRDWVVVGATPQQLLDQGYFPIGKDFPVFLHPSSKEEVALARTERKVSTGYHGFEFHAAPEVTLEQDLQRRDLTINAMARDAQGQLIDPYGGQRDLNARRLRHVSAAFSEDPVRILRIARFAARLPDFSIAPETLTLMRHMVQHGEVDALVPERVWQEVARGLMEQRPSRLLETLHDCGALQVLWPELPYGTELLAALNRCPDLHAALPVRFAVLVGQHAEVLKTRFKAPNDCQQLARLAQQQRAQLEDFAVLSTEEIVTVLERCDVFRKPQRFEQLLQVIHAEHSNFVFSTAWKNAMHTVKSVDAGAIAQQLVGQPEKIGAALRQARVQAVQWVVKKT